MPALVAPGPRGGVGSTPTTRRAGGAANAPAPDQEAELHGHEATYRDLAHGRRPRHHRQALHGQPAMSQFLGPQREPGPVAIQKGIDALIAHLNEKHPGYRWRVVRKEDVEPGTPTRDLAVAG